MSQPAIQVDGLWKKFRKGELHDSLREWVPAMVKRIARGRPPGDELNTRREFWALKDISFELQRGQSLGVIGPNGAGKSTLLKVLSRILKPNRGSYRIHGRLSSLIEVGAGFHGDLTGRENIYLNGAILGMSRRELRDREEAIIEFAGISDFIDTPVKRYSSGMGARLGFAVAAHMSPDILLIDEVLSVGDARFRTKCVEHMRKLLTGDVAVVFISHILDQVRSLCPRTMVLDHGAMAYMGPTDAGIRKYLDLLADPNTGGDSGSEGSPAELRNIRFLDADGREALEWKCRCPGFIAFDLIIKRPGETKGLLFNLTTIGGQFLGCVGRDLPGLIPTDRAGTFPVRVMIDPMPLAEGDYSITAEVYQHEGNRICWMLRQPRVFSVRGTGSGGLLIDFVHRWEADEPAVSQPVA